MSGIVADDIEGIAGLGISEADNAQFLIGETLSEFDKLPAVGGESCVVIAGAIPAVAVFVTVGGVESDLTLFEVVQFAEGIGDDKLQFFQIGSVEMFRFNGEGSCFGTGMGMCTGKHDRRLRELHDIGAFFSQVLDIPLIQTEKVKGDEEDFFFAVIHAEAVSIQVIQFCFGFVNEAVTCEISSDFGGDIFFEPCNFHKEFLVLRY
jgi:hypothetical protein